MVVTRVDQMAEKRAGMRVGLMVPMKAGTTAGWRVEMMVG